MFLLIVIYTFVITAYACMVENEKKILLKNKFEVAKRICYECM